MPAVIEGGEPQLLSDIAILKRNLVVKSARDVGLHDIEQCCLGQKVDKYFAKSDVEPSVVSLIETRVTTLAAQLS